MMMDALLFVFNMALLWREVATAFTATSLHHHHHQFSNNNLKPSFITTTPSFSYPGRQQQQQQLATSSSSSSALYFNIKGMLDKAFANDENLSKNENALAGQIVGLGDELVEISQEEEQAAAASSWSSSDVALRQLTPTQLKWRALREEEEAAAAASKTATTTTAALSLAGKTLSLDLYLSGVSNKKDPSSDLFGSRINISARDKQLGLSLPDQPTVSDVQVTFWGDDNDNDNETKKGKCLCLTDTGFTESQQEGDWILDDRGSRNGGSTTTTTTERAVRFRIPVTGYTRTVETRGSIQSVAWSSAPDQAVAASTTYTIPAGWLYGEGTLVATRRGGGSSRRKGNALLQWKDDQGGVLKIEQSVGLLGAGSKLVPCGRFQAKLVEKVPQEEGEKEDAKAAATSSEKQ